MALDGGGISTRSSSSSRTEHPPIALNTTLHLLNYTPMDFCPKPSSLNLSFPPHNNGTTITSCNEHKPNSPLVLHLPSFFSHCGWNYKCSNTSQQKKCTRLVRAFALPNFVDVEQHCHACSTTQEKIDSSDLWLHDWSQRQHWKWCSGSIVAVWCHTPH